jgi:hypothetical protein
MDMELGPGYSVENPIAFSAERTNEVRVAFNKEGIWEWIFSSTREPRPPMVLSSYPGCF